jgi:hypothetical protein
MFVIPPFIMVSTPPIPHNRPLGLGLQTLWYLGCILSLGYASKYSRRIEDWQVYDPSIYDQEYKAYSLPINTKWLGLESSKRAKQQVSNDQTNYAYILTLLLQKEWDRLMVPVSSLA